MKAHLAVMLVLAFAATGCDDDEAEAPNDGPLADAARGPDGRIVDAGHAPDANLHAPDANLHAPDAAIVHAPDAAVIHNPDAEVKKPDAAVHLADAPATTESPDAGPSSSRETARMLGSTDAANGFYEYLPPGYGDDTPRPLMVFWHGIGENGNGTTDLAKVRANGPPKLIHANQWPSDRPFIVLSPQHVNNGGCPSSGEIKNFIAFAMSHYTVDAHRVYLTGLSCGAIGSWQYVNDNLNTVIAAAVLIAGDPGDPNQSYSNWGKHGCGLGALPIWIFHGDADPTVNPADDTNTMTKLLACPAPPRTDDMFTLYPGVGHDSWSRTYDLSAGHDIYAWMLDHENP